MLLLWISAVTQSQKGILALGHLLTFYTCSISWKAMVDKNYVLNATLIWLPSLCLSLQDFEKNSFQQMCINFANETLQFFFNQFVFRMEQVSITLQYYASHSQLLFVVHHAIKSPLIIKTVVFQVVGHWVCWTQ